MNYGRLKYLLFLLSISIGVSCNKTPVEEFEEILSQERYVAALFTKKCCACVECVEAEALLATFSLDLLNDLQIVSVKLVDETKLANSFGIKEFPTIVFLRDHTPVLFDGKFEKEELLYWFEKSKEVALKELDDESFEHLTQAATGATTGHWLVAFHGKSCDNTAQHALTAVLDTVAVKMLNKVNVAKVNIENSPILTERFKITTCPQILFFRLGKMYEYNLPGLKVGSLISFVDGFYRNSKSVPVPKEKSPFDILVEKSAKFVKENMVASIAGLSSFILAILLLLYCSRESEKDRRKTE